jgi:hypothetical protein
VSDLKLFMVLLGCKPAGRHTEQHDIFFGVATSINELVPEIKEFWKEVGDKIHIDAWREVTVVDGYELKILLRPEKDASAKRTHQLFFINLGGYQHKVFGEQHYVMLSVKEDKSSALKASKETTFFQVNHTEGATSHIDDKYGIDVDDIYEIDEILSPQQRSKYKIEITPYAGSVEDEMHLGYLKLSQLA